MRIDPKAMTIAAAVAILWPLCGSARADTIPSGNNYWAARPSLGLVRGLCFDDFDKVCLDSDAPLTGLPTGPGNADTIVRRLAAVQLAGPGSLATIPIELLGLSLVTSGPVMVRDARGPSPVSSFFDVFITLTPNTPSMGLMTVRQETASGGTFDSFFDVFGDVLLVPGTGGPPEMFSGGGTFRTLQPALWSVVPEAGAVDADGFSLTGLATFGIFDGTQSVGQVTFSSATTTPIPEPASLYLLGAGLAGAVRARRKLRNKV